MNPASEKFLADIRSDNAELRFAAWRRAGEMEPEVIPELGKLLIAEAPAVRNAADESLKTMVNSVGKEPGGAKRAAVARQLIALTDNGQPTWVRTVALRHLSLIGGDETVPAAAKLLTNPELREEAVYCLERIPGSASNAALMAAMSRVDASFLPRILAALGHRRVEEATALCATAEGSKNVEIAVAGMAALARIGKQPRVEPKPPNYESLSAWQKTEFTDNPCCRAYADEQVRRGNAAGGIKRSIARCWSVRKSTCNAPQLSD